MITKYNANINKEIIYNNLHRLIGQTYKLLPYNEEKLDWKKPLITIQNELAGMDSLFSDYQEFQRNLFSLECKLEGLFNCADDFETFRRTIFECIEKIKKLQDLL